MKKYSHENPAVFPPESITHSENQRTHFGLSEEVHVSVGSWWRWSGPQLIQIWLIRLVMSVDVNRLIKQLVYVDQLRLSRPPGSEPSAVKLEARVFTFVSTTKCHHHMLFLQKSPLSSFLLPVVSSAFSGDLPSCRKWQRHFSHQPLWKSDTWKHLSVLVCGVLVSFRMKHSRLCVDECVWSGEAAGRGGERSAVWWSACFVPFTPNCPEVQVRWMLSHIYFVQ